MELMTQEQIRAQLAVSKQQGSLVEVHDFDEAGETFDVGFVLAVDELFVLLLGIDWDGKINGLTAVRLASIHRVRSQTDYLTTVSLKCKVAQENGYFDLWHLQDFLHDHDYQGKNILRTLLTDSYQNDLPLVIGTKKYKGGDDFTGVISDLRTIKLTLHYFNSHDLSSLWEYEILLAQIDYVRVRGTQTATARKVLDQVFHQE